MRRHPVILIPGIQGTKLLDSNQKDFKMIWSGVRKFFSDIHQLTLRDNGVSDKHLDAVIERADVEDIAYSELINYLRAEGYRVYIFGYDWRKSNEVSAQRLAEFIEKLKKKFGNINSFNFITHSMGGLVLSAYLKTLESKQRSEVIEHAIMTVPPFLGSMEAALSLTVGSSMLCNSSDDFRKVARTFPSMYELLPVYEDAYQFKSPQSTDNYDPYQFDTYWQQVANADRDDTLSKQALIRARLEHLQKVRNQNNLVFDFSNQDPELLKKCIIISGIGSETRQSTSILEQYKHYKYFFNFEEKPSSTDGDGTVPAKSAHAFKDHILTISIKKSGLESWLDSRFLSGDQHGFILNNGRVQNIITRFLKDSTDNDNWFESADDIVNKVT